MATMTLPVLITACSMASTPLINDMLYNIAMGHSKGNYLYIHNYSTNGTYHPSTKAQAIALAKAFSAPNHVFYAGLTGLNPVHIKKWKLNYHQAFDACTNIKVASYELSDLFKKYRITRRNKATEHKIHKALAQYYMPHHPNHTDAIDWGALILSQAKVSVAKQLKSAHPLPTATYTVVHREIKNKRSGRRRRRTRSNDGLIVNVKSQRRPEKFPINPPKKKKDKTTTPKLKPKDMLPHQIGGPIRKSTHEKLQ